MTMNPLFVPLYAAAPYGLRALSFEPRSTACLRGLVRDGAYDLALVPGDNRLSWLAAALGSRWIVALAGDRPRSKNLLVDEQIDWPEEATDASRIFAGLAGGVEAEPYASGDWPPPPYQPFELPRRPYAVLHVGASTPLKHWPYWGELAGRLAERGLALAWSGGTGDDKLVAAIDPDLRWPSYAGRLDLPQLWHLLREAALVVSPDTGVAHLARLAGAPLITLFGPGSAAIHGSGAFWQRQRHVSVTVADFPCRDQRSLFKRELPWVRRCHRSPAQCTNNRCMQAIAPAQVLAAVDTLLAT